MNTKVIELARELLETSDYLWEKAIEMAEEELGIGYYDENQRCVGLSYTYE